MLFLLVPEYESINITYCQRKSTIFCQSRNKMLIG